MATGRLVGVVERVVGVSGRVVGVTGRLEASKGSFCVTPVVDDGSLFRRVPKS